jgi:menaquinone-dependent protoporphyrinogen oxidase
MKTLIVYGSAYGQTERIVGHIASILRDAGDEVTLYRGNELPPALALEPFDRYLVAASVLYGRHQSYIRSFVSRNVAALNARPSAFISVSGSAGSADPAGRAQAAAIARRFADELGWRPRAVRTFGGAITYSRYGWVLSRVMRWISRRNGRPTDMTADFVLTDWESVTAFAREIGAGMRRADRRGAPAVDTGVTDDADAVSATCTG